VAVTIPKAVATMIDPLLASQAERLAALRSPAQKKRQKPAHSAKIFTAGISTTALFGLVAAMGWPTGNGIAQGAAAVEPAVTPVALTIPALTIPAPAAAVQTAPVVIPATAVVAAPVPTVAAPIVIPVAVPAAQRPAAPAASNTTTKSSG
jgi:hypothetical protein